MREEARLEPGERGGLVPHGDGWFVVNVRDARWRESPRFGAWAAFEGAERFPHLGLNVHVLQPGQAACMYHAEAAQEGFLVLDGECLLVVEEREHPLARWDFFHCAPGTRHVLVGAGAGPCAILMIGARGGDPGLEYPVSPVAARHGASVAKATRDPREAYAGTPPPHEVPAPWPPPEPPPVSPSAGSGR